MRLLGIKLKHILMGREGGGRREGKRGRGGEGGVVTRRHYLSILLDVSPVNTGGPFLKAL